MTIGLKVMKKKLQYKKYLAKKNIKSLPSYFTIKSIFIHQGDSKSLSNLWVRGIFNLNN